MAVEKALVMVLITLFVCIGSLFASGFSEKISIVDVECNNSIVSVNSFDSINDILETAFIN